MPHKEIKLSDRVRKSVKNANDFELTVTIRGSFYCIDFIGEIVR